MENKEPKAKEVKEVKSKEEKGSKVLSVFFALHIDIMPIQKRSILSMQADETTELILKENHLLIIKNKTIKIAVPLSNIRCLVLE